MTTNLFGKKFVFTNRNSENYDGKIYLEAGKGEELIINGSSTIGNVSGPASSVDNSVARFDGTTGKIIQSSDIIIDDASNISGANTVETNVLRLNDNLNSISITAPTLVSDYTLTLPNGVGTANQVLSTDGSGVLSWADGGGGTAEELSKLVSYPNIDSITLNNTLSQTEALAEEGKSIAMWGSDLFATRPGAGNGLRLYTETGGVWSYDSLYNFSTCPITPDCVSINENIVAASTVSGGCVVGLKSGGSWSAATYSGSNAPITSDTITCFSDGTNHIVVGIDIANDPKTMQIITDTGSGFPATSTDITLSLDAICLAINDEYIFVGQVNQMSVYLHDGTLSTILYGMVDSIDFGLSVDCSNSTMITNDSSRVYVYDIVSSELRLTSVFSRAFPISHVFLDRQNSRRLLLSYETGGINYQSYYSRIQTSFNWKLNIGLNTSGNQNASFYGTTIAFGIPSANGDDGEILVYDLNEIFATEKIGDISLDVNTGLVFSGEGRNNVLINPSGSQNNQANSEYSGAVQMESCGMNSMFSNLGRINTLASNDVKITGSLTMSQGITGLPWGYYVGGAGGSTVAVSGSVGFLGASNIYDNWADNGSSEVVVNGDGSMTLTSGNYLISIGAIASGAQIDTGKYMILDFTGAVGTAIGGGNESKVLMFRSVINYYVRFTQTETIHVRARVSPIPTGRDWLGTTPSTYFFVQKIAE